MAFFSSLSNELIEHVASYLPCSSVLNLSKTNRRFHQIGNDRLLLQSIAKNSLYTIQGAEKALLDKARDWIAPVGMLSFLAWPEGVELLQDASLEDTKRVAFAVEKCTLASMQKDNEWLLERRGRVSTWFKCSEWLPTVLALHHPSILGLDVYNLVYLQSELTLAPSTRGQSPLATTSPTASRKAPAKADPEGLRCRTAEFINVNFIVTYMMLQYCQTKASSGDGAEPNGAFIIPISREDATPGVSSMEFIALLTTLRSHVPDWGVYTDGFSLAQATAVLIPLLFDYCGHANARGHVRVQDTLPTPGKIPFLHTMKIPRLFEGSVQAFSTCHVDKMIAPEFLSGSWVGFFTNSRFALANHFDTPMRNIEFVTHAATEDRAHGLRMRTVVGRETKGDDAHGEFMLVGHVNTDGSVHLTKLYSQLNWRWTWKGFVTPWGIVASWRSGDEFGGYVWIWKEEWGGSA